MSSSMAFLTRSRAVLKTLNPQYSVKSISTFSFLSQEAQLSEPEPEPAQPLSSPTPTPLPPNPATGSPLYNQNWRTPLPNAPFSLIPVGYRFPSQIPSSSQTQYLDLPTIMDKFADLMTKKRWNEMKGEFELWIQSSDKNGKPNQPDVNLYNLYLRANLMMGAFPGDLLDLVANMSSYGIVPNTASYNLVLKGMHQAGEIQAAEKLLDQMIQTGKEFKESSPDGESFDLVAGMLLRAGQIDTALTYIDLTLKSGYLLPMDTFIECVKRCVNNGRLDTLVSVIERCKKMEENKALCPPWNLCIYIADIAMQEDNADLAIFALESLIKWIIRGEATRPLRLLSVDEGLVVSALGTAGRTNSSKLIDHSWSVLKRSLRQKKVPNPETYLAKIYAHASLGHLPKAFSTLLDYEAAFKGSTKDATEDLFSPFTSLYPLVLACSRKGFETLDLVYYQLEHLKSKSDRPLKSVAALNCIVLGCANIWDLDRAYQTFSAIETDFGLTPDIHSYNALICAFGKLHKRDEAVKVYEHFLSLGVKPNANTYSLLVDAHLIKRDPKSALSVINDMVVAGFEPSKEILKKVRRRCSREMYYESNDQVEAIAKNFRIRMGAESRRELLFNLEFTTDYES